MQIAKVAPKVKTLGTGIFDYAIPPEILPEIQTGVLVEVPFGNRIVEGIVIEIRRTSTISKLKSIKRIIDPIPVIDDGHLMLAKWMADYYLSSLGQTLFENIVPPAIRTIKKQIDINIASKKNQSIDVKKNRSFLILADFSHRLNFYLKAIAKTLKSGQSVLILVPDLTLISYFTQVVKNPIILHSGLTKTQRWTAWDKARNQSSSIIIGSTSALFAPVNNLGLIIIDQVDDETYKNDRSPRFLAQTVAEKLVKISNADLILGSLNPGLETYFYATKNRYKILKNKFSKPNVEIVDMKAEKGFLSHTLILAIEKSIQKNEKIILVLNRKINGGTKKLAQIVRTLWPLEKIINLESGGDKFTNDFRLAIATSYALKLPLPKIGLVGIIDGDAFMFLPDFRSAERDFLNFFKFLKISTHGVIQTKNPDHYFVASLAKLDYDQYYQAELKVREENFFPPFWHLINLTYQNKDEVLAQKEAEKLAKQLKKFENVDNSMIQIVCILGPNPAFFRKIRNSYRWQIIIKLKQNRPAELDTLLKKQNGWRIDVDPVNLM